MSEENSKPGLTFEALFDQLVQNQGHTNAGQTDTFPTGPDCQNDKRQAKSDDELLADGLSQVTLKEGETKVASVPGPSASPTGAGDSGKKIKIASWNIKQLTDSDELRLDAISGVISTKGFDVVAIQEIHSQDVLKKIKAKLPSDVIWDCVVSPFAGYGHEAWESFGFLYKKKSGIELTASALMAVKITHDKYTVLDDVEEANNTEVRLTESILRGEKENFTRKPYLGLFKINEIEFSLITVHNIFSVEERKKNEAKTLVKLNQLVDFGKNVIILGDFNLSPTDEAIKGLKDEYESCITGPTNVNRDKEYDNIWIRKTMLDRFSKVKEESGVVTTGLKYKKDGHDTDISDHCPIYVT